MSRRTLSPAIVFTVFSFACVSGFSVVTSNFTNGAGGDWHNAGNWDAGVPDGIDDQAIMLANPGGTVSVTGAVATIGLLRSTTDSDFSISTPLTFSVSSGSAALEMGTGNAGALTLSSSITLDSSLGITLARPSPGNLTISGNISGNGGLSYSGTNSSQLFLTGTNSYLGSTSITTKTVNINSSNSIPSGSTLNLINSGNVNITAPGITLGSPIAIDNGSTLNNNGNNVVLSGTLSGTSGASNLQLTGSGTVSITGTSTTLPITVNQGTLALSTTGDLSESPITLAGTSILDITGVSGASGSVGLLNGPAGTSVVATGKNLTLNGGTGRTGSFSGVISGVGTSLNLTNLVIQILGGVNTYDGATSISGNSVLGISGTSNIPSGSPIDLDAGTLQCTGTFTLPNTLTISSVGNIEVPSGTITIPNGIGGVGNQFGTLGNGTVILSITGSIPVGMFTNIGSGSTLRAGAADVLSPSQFLVTSGTFDANGFDQSIGDLSGSGQITLGSKVLTVNTSSAGVFTGVISGSGGSLVVNGVGGLTLRGLNTYTGGTTVNGGSFNIPDNNTLPIGGNLVVNDPAVMTMIGSTQSVGNFSGSASVFLGSVGSLTVTPTSPSTYSGVISGSSGSSLIKAGSSILTLTGANTFSGTTTINNGTLALSGSGALSASGTVNVNSSTSILDVSGVTTSTTIGNLTGVASSSVVLGSKTLTCGSSASSTFPGIISGVGGALTKTGTGTLTLSGANTYTGTTTITNGTLALSGSGSLSSAGTVNVNSATSIFNISAVTTSATIGNLSGVASSSVVLGSKTLTCGTSTNSTFAGIISGVGSLAKVGSGTLTLSGVNTYTGGTAINAGSISISGSSNLSSGAVSIGASGTLLATGGTYTVANNMSVSSGSTISVTGTQLTASGVISGSGGSLTKTGSGILVLSGANTYDGGTTISAGTLTPGANNVMPSGGAVAVTGTFNVNNTTQSIGNLSGAGPTTLGSGTLTVTPSSPSTYSGIISGGTGSLVKAGSSSLVLSGVNTYGGGTTISGGTLSISAGTGVGLGAVAIGAAGTLQGTGATYTLTNNISLGSGSTIDVTATQMTASGVISGVGGSLTKTGAGTLVLSGTNIYSGGTAINAGTLSISGSSNLSSGAISIGGAGTLLGTGATYTLTNNISVSSGSTVSVTATQMTASGVISGAGGSLTKTGSGILVLSGANTYDGGTTISAGTLTPGANNVMPSGGAVAVTGTFNVNNTTQSIGNLSGAGPTTLGSGILTVTPSSPSTYSGIISGGTGSLVKAGSSALTLSGVNTYGGGTTISGGVLSISAGTGAGLGAVAIGAAGTLQGTGATYTLTNNISLGSGSTIDVTATQMTASGVISGAGGSLTKTGSGTLVVSGANTYDGGTTISAGTLKAGANNAIPTGRDVSVAGIFDVDTTTQSIGNLTGSGSTNIAAAGLLTVAPSSNITYTGTLTGAGDVSKQGSSQWQLTASSTSFTGLCTVAGGELKLNGALGSGGAGAVTVNPGAIFSGNATVGGALTCHGTVSPGNSVGTMVVGSLVLGPNSIVDVDINDALQSDIFTVSPGTAAINGTLSVNFLPGVYTTGLTYTIINAPAGVSGTFASVTDNSPDFNIKAIYTGTTVELTIISPGGAVFRRLPLSGNAKSVADNINAISAADTLTSDPDLNNAVEVLVGQSLAVISDALQRLDPTPYTTIGATTALASPMLAEFFAGKKRKSCCPSQFGCEEGKWNVWADPFIMHFDQGARGSQDGFEALASGFAIGAERGLSKEWKVGVGFAYDHLSIDFGKHRGSSGCNDSYLALFADGEGKQWHFACALLGGIDAISNERKIQYLSINSKAHSDYLAGELIAQASGAYYFGPNTRQFQLYGTITSDTLFEPSIHEHGAGGLNLKIRSNTSSVLVSQAGILFKQRKEFANGCWGPDLWLGYVNEAYLTNGKLRSNFVNQVIPFTTIGVHKTQNLVETGLSMSLLLNKGFSLAGTYYAQIGGRLVTQNGDLRFRWMF